MSFLGCEEPEPLGKQRAALRPTCLLLSSSCAPCWNKDESWVPINEEAGGNGPPSVSMTTKRLWSISAAVLKAARERRRWPEMDWICKSTAPWWRRGAWLLTGSSFPRYTPAGWSGSAGERVNGGQAEHEKPPARQRWTSCAFRLMALQPKTHPTGRGGARWAGLTAHKRRRSEFSERKHLARLWGAISRLAEHKQQQLKITFTGTTGNLQRFRLRFSRSIRHGRHAWSKRTHQR